MKCRHDLRALADCCGDTLHRAGAHVADRKYAPAVCLQGGPALGGGRPGQYESLSVQRYSRSGQPIGVRLRSDEEKQMLNRPPHVLSLAASTPLDCFEHRVAAFDA